MPPEYIVRYSHICTRCSYEWLSKLVKPVRCANCNNPYWDRIKKQKPIIAN